MRKGYVTSVACSGVLLLMTAAAAAGPAPGTPNSVKYKNTGIKPATGRSGSASLEARALIGRDASTQVEATTGSLEAGTAPGNINKTQVKFVERGVTKNFNTLKAGGYWTGTFSGVSRGNQVQVQANISGIDPRRTDVVTVMAQAALRPDVAVLSVSGPAQALPQNEVTFIAAVSELNGDVGARADCVLSVDGTDVDQSAGIWVDAGGAVSCVFTHVFEATGTYQVGVRAAGVNPGDWDTANNAAATSITIQALGNPISSGYLQAIEDNYDQEWASDYGYAWYNGSQRVHYSNVYFQGWNPQYSPHPLTRVDVAISVGGSPAYSASLTPNQLYQYDDGTYWSHCEYFSLESYVTTGTHSEYQSTGDYAQRCSAGDSYGNQNSWFYYQRVSGEVSYFSDNSYYGISSSEYTYGSGSPYGWAAGAAVRAQLSFMDAGGNAQTADRSVTLEDRSSDVNHYYNDGSAWSRSVGTRVLGFIQW